MNKKNFLIFIFFIFLNNVFFSIDHDEEDGYPKDNYFEYSYLENKNALNFSIRPLFKDLKSNNNTFDTKEINNNLIEKNNLNFVNNNYNNNELEQNDSNYLYLQKSNSGKENNLKAEQIDQNLFHKNNLINNDNQANNNDLSTLEKEEVQTNNEELAKNNNLILQQNTATENISNEDTPNENTFNENIANEIENNIVQSTNKIDKSKKYESESNSEFELLKNINEYDLAKKNFIQQCVEKDFIKIKNAFNIIEKSLQALKVDLSKKENNVFLNKAYKNLNKDQILNKLESFIEKFNAENSFILFENKKDELNNYVSAFNDFLKTNSAVFKNFKEYKNIIKNTKVVQTTLKNFESNKVKAKSLIESKLQYVEQKEEKLKKIIFILINGVKNLKAVPILGLNEYLNNTEEIDSSDLKFNNYNEIQAFEMKIAFLLEVFEKKNNSNAVKILKELKNNCADLKELRIKALDLSKGVKDFDFKAYWKELFSKNLFTLKEFLNSLSVIFDFRNLAEKKLIINKAKKFVQNENIVFNISKEVVNLLKEYPLSEEDNSVAIINDLIDCNNDYSKNLYSILKNCNESKKNILIAQIKKLQLKASVLAEISNSIISFNPKNDDLKNFMDSNYKKLKNAILEYSNKK